MLSWVGRRRHWWLGVLLPVVLLVGLTLHYSVHVPFWDQWEFVEILKHNANHTLSFNDFWHQHNEHRIFFPRLIMFGLAWLTHWDPYWEVVVSLLLGLGILAVVLRLIGRHFRGNQRIILSVASAWFLMSPLQWENWLWGWQIQWYLMVLMVVLAIDLLSRPKLSRWQVIGAVVAGLVATFSLANGFIIWIVGGLLLMVKRSNPKQLLAWLAIGGLATMTYYLDYANPAGHPSKSLFLSQPVAFVKYVLVFLGRPLGLGHRSSLVAGFVLVIVFLLGAWYVWRSARQRAALWPWLGLGLFGAMSAVVTAISRLGFGVDQALSSRYTTISILFIVATLAIGCLVYEQAREHRPKQLLLPQMASVALGLVALLGGMTYAQGVHAMRGQHRHLVEVEACLQTVDNPANPCLLKTYPNGLVAFERLEFLRQQHLGGHISKH